MNDEVREVLAAWEAAGQRVETPHGKVWWREVPSSTTGDRGGAVDGEGGDRWDRTGGSDGFDPIIVLHGFPTASFDWRHVLDALCEHRRVVLFDFLGFGLSDKPDVRYSLEMQADAAEAVAEAAGLERVALVSHDMGDSVGGELLARSLEGRLGFEVSRRVLTNGSIYIGLAQLTAGQQLLLSLDDARVDLGDDGSGYGGGLAATFAPDRQPDAFELDAQWALMSRDRGQTLLARTIRYIEDRRANETRYTGAIEKHPSPLGVIWGRLDPVAVHAMAERLVQARPGTPLVTLDDVAHWPMIEAPERFAEATLALLDG